MSLPSGRREVWIKPHRRFWLYWWKVLSKETELASTLFLKRRWNKWYAIFVFDLTPKKETPAEVVAFDVNENWAAVARLSLLSTVDAVAQWNRRYIDPTVYFIRTDFDRLAKRHEAVRNAKLEELKQKYPFAGRDDEEKVQNVTDAKEGGSPIPIRLRPGATRAPFCNPHSLRAYGLGTAATATLALATTRQASPIPPVSTLPYTKRWQELR